MYLFLPCGCLCCSSDPRVAVHEEGRRCLGGTLVRRVTCGRRCAFWVPKKRIDQFIALSALLALLCVVVAGLSLVAGRVEVQHQVNRWVVLDSPESHSYDRWSGTSSSPSCSSSSVTVYAFDVRNPTAVLTEAAPAELVEMGPVKYRVHRRRFDVSWSDEGDELQFTTWTSYHFDEAASVAGLDPTKTTATNVDLAALTLFELLPGVATDLTEDGDELLAFLESEVCVDPDSLPKFCGGGADVIAAWLDSSDVIWKTFFKRLLCADSHGSTPFVERTLHDMVFGGSASVLQTLHGVLRGVEALLAQVDGAVDDPSLEVALEHSLATVTTLADTLITTSPPLLRNATSAAEARYYSNPDVICTGRGSRRHGRAQVGKYRSRQGATGMFQCAASLTTDEAVNSSTRMCPPFESSWSATEAAAEGWQQLWHGHEEVSDSSNGEQFRPANWWTGRAHETLSVVSEALSRPVPLELTHHSGEVEGLATRRYAVPDSVLENADVRPDNDVFEQWGPSGLANLTSGLGLPLFVSRPHFLRGDDDLLVSVQGLRPDSVVHETLVDVEPVTGVAASSAQRWQVNALVTNWSLPTISQGADDVLLLLEEAVYYALCVRHNTTAQSQALCDFLAGRDQALTACLAEPGQWTLQGQGQDWAGLFVPWAWTDETTSLNPQTVSGLHDDTTSASDRASLAAHVLLGFAVAFVLLFLVGIVARLTARQLAEDPYSKRLLDDGASLDGSVSSLERAWLDNGATQQESRVLMKSSSVANLAES